jgi:hypothetical protein
MKKPAEMSTFELHENINQSNRAIHTKELQRRFDDNVDGYRDHIRNFIDKSNKDEWIERQDNKPSDPQVVGPLCRRMLASGWDMSGFRKPASFIRRFLENPDIQCLSELEMSTEQRRLWRSIKDQWREYLKVRA